MDRMILGVMVAVVVALGFVSVMYERERSARQLAETRLAEHLQADDRKPLQQAVEGAERDFESKRKVYEKNRADFMRSWPSCPR